MKKSNYGKMFSAALMMMAAMTMTSCSGSKKIYGGSNVGESSDMGKNEEDLAIWFFLKSSMMLSIRIMSLHFDCLIKSRVSLHR